MRMKQLSRAAAILSVPLLIAAVIGASCGDDNNGTTGGQGGASGLGGAGGLGGATGAGGATAVDSGVIDAATAAATFDINIENAGPSAYSPTELIVPAGATVTVHNIDTVAHTVTSEAAWGNFVPGAVGGVSFNTGAIAPGTTATIAIPATAGAGTIIPYFCTIHGASMGQGRIILR